MNAAPHAVSIDCEPWMRETTIKNREIQKHAIRDDASAVRELDRVIGNLSGG